MIHKRFEKKEEKINDNKITVKRKSLTVNFHFFFFVWMFKSVFSKTHIYTYNIKYACWKMHTKSTLQFFIYPLLAFIQTLWNHSLWSNELLPLLCCCLLFLFFTTQTFALKCNCICVNACQKYAHIYNKNKIKCKKKIK